MLLCLYKLQPSSLPSRPGVFPQVAFKTQLPTNHFLSAGIIKRKKTPSISHQALRTSQRLNGRGVAPASKAVSPRNGASSPLQNVCGGATTLCSKFAHIFNLTVERTASCSLLLTVRAYLLPALHNDGSWMSRQELLCAKEAP